MRRQPTPMPTPCILWDKCRDKDGYGVIQREGWGQRAHRWHWKLVHGPIPDGMVVMHLCDNPPCINVDHLKLGTVAENNADRARKGRSASHRGVKRPACSQPGERHPMSKLTEADVLAIRAAVAAGAETQRAIAKRFNVSPSTVTVIKQRRHWAHI